MTMEQTVYIIVRKKVRPEKDLYLVGIGNFGINMFATDIFRAMKWEDPIDLNELPKSIREDTSLSVIRVSYMAEVVG